VSSWPARQSGSKVIILDEPTAALGVKESGKVLDLIQDVRSRGTPVVLISHNMPHVFEVADCIHIHRLRRRLCVVDPKSISMSDAVALMTGAMQPDKVVPAYRYRRASTSDERLDQYRGLDCAAAL
jgi:fructose transport system ATP-binding protein